MRSYPLFVRFSEKVQGAGFSAIVSGTCRILLTDQGPEDWLCQSVEPANWLLSAKDAMTASRSYRVLLSDLAQSIAQEAATFADCRRAVLDSFREDADVAALWRSAVEDMRSNPSALVAPFDKLPKWDADSQKSVIQIELVEDVFSDDHRTTVAMPELKAA